MSQGPAEAGAGQTWRAGPRWAQRLGRSSSETHDGVTHGLGLSGRAVLTREAEKGGEAAPLLWTWVYFQRERERKSDAVRLKPDGAGPGWGEAEPRRDA